jgi:Tryptophan halogenase
MKIAVLGGGTAGFIAAAHLTRYLPQADLLHIFDSRIPTIGVGEGTTPRFPPLKAEGVVTWEQRGTRSFPNFLCRRMFDGRIFLDR